MIESIWRALHPTPQPEWPPKIWKCPVGDVYIGNILKFCPDHGERLIDITNAVCKNGHKWHWSWKFCGHCGSEMREEADA